MLLEGVGAELDGTAEADVDGVGLVVVVAAEELVDPEDGVAEWVWVAGCARVKL